MITLSRRQFVQGAGMAGLAILAGCSLPFSRPEATASLRRIGYLEPAPPRNRAISGLEAFREGLRALGYVEGRDVELEVRYADSDREQLQVLAAELVQLDPAVIVAATATGAQAAKHTTSTIPVIFPVASDPVLTGLVDSLAHPGGNVSGLSLMTPALSGKRLQLLAEMTPGIVRVALPYSALTIDASAQSNIRETQMAAETLGLQVQPFKVEQAGELQAALDTARAWGADALLTIPDFFSANEQAQFTAFAASQRLPAMYALSNYMEVGGLMYYGPNFIDLYRRAATYVDRILKGAKPADLPVEQPTKFDFVINLKTAQALGLTIPQQVLLQATEVIQ